MSHTRGCFLAVAGLLLISFAPAPAQGVTTLTVDLAQATGPAKHVASGSLYGVTEMLPADVTKLIAPLHPNMFNNPAANVQQPRGDAILVATRLAPTGARVTIRLADWFPSWPYKFTNVNDWFDKLGQTVSRKQASGVDNYYGYEIWNEPNGTWTSSSLAFNDFWKQSFQKLRELDPSAKIIGPSISYYDRNYLNSFLTFAKANDCVPDIVGWHELSGGDVGGNIQNYRSMEKQLGIGPLPISINEYSGKDHIDDEGQPGASAPLIAKFERLGVDTACITYWDVAHAGRLGSLLATDTTPNGGYWFYKWYGEMNGNMVATTPPAANDVSTLDGFANLDASTHSASVLFGGSNDGSVQIVVKGFQTAAVLGSKVHAVVEHTPFVNRTTAVSAANTVSTADLDVKNDQIAVTISSTNGSDGYRLSLTSLDGGAGAPGTGGASGMGGTSAQGGTTAGGGSDAGAAHGGAATSAGSGGTPASAGQTAGGAPGSAGGTHDGGAGVPALGGGGGASSAGASSSGSAGAPTHLSGAGGAPNASGATGGNTSVAAASANTPSDAASSDGGCGCSVPRRTSPLGAAALGLGAALLLLRRRRSH